ncbi:methyl-accepting chemotaxis protein [Massilia sp. 9096]|uniref:methyl-accepting chemotaxis protein n=1 Tax=Massilia sp. 9096 TaxID=1500894 RepID=UPI00056B46C8|nr:methyl-accepting chemotaxis protein [Massilia sp. 9096]
MNIANLKIGTRLALGFGFVCTALVFMVGQGTVMLGRVNDGTHDIVDMRIPRVEMVTRQHSLTNEIAIAVRNVMLSDDADDRAKQLEKIAASRKEIDEILKKLDATLQNEKAREVLAREHALNEKYGAKLQVLIQMFQGGDDAGARTLLRKEVRPILIEYKEAMDEQVRIQQALSTQTAADAQHTYESTRTLMIVLGAVVVAFAAALAWWITSSITRGLRSALDVANAVAAGDLTTKVEVHGNDEIGQLLAALKTMNANLAETVRTVRTGTETISVASREVAAGSQDLSSRTEQQAGSLEETASSMEELTSTVRQNADNARQANQLAATASGVAARGGEVIESVVATMGQIHAASGKITDIISVIDGIAFQTNILALNAAVEAARAGEQGRGFAVVAGEVRNLAQRAAAAAREIKGLIDDSSGRVEEGSRLVQEAGSTMSEIVESVRRVTDILDEIGTASGEQSAGIEQINEAITQMDGVTQQNAALVEEAAAAAESMQEQAGKLAEAVAVFKLDHAAPAVAAFSAGAAKPALAKAAAAKPARPLPAPRATPAPVRAPAPARAPARTPARVPAHEAAGDWEEF